MSQPIQYTALKIILKSSQNCWLLLGTEDFSEITQANVSLKQPDSKLPSWNYRSLCQNSLDSRWTETQEEKDNRQEENT